MRPGPTTVAAGTALCASMIADATGVPARSPSRAAASGVSAADRAPRRHDLAAELLRHVREARVERAEELARREPALRAPEALVSRAARVAHQLARQRGDEPVARLDEARRGGVDLRVLLERLQRLRDEPLGRRPSAVVGEERVSPLRGERVDAVRLRLRGVVLPELHPRVRMTGPLRIQAQGTPVRVDRQDRRGREVDADPGDRLGGDSRRGQGRRHGALDRRQVVAGMLERPVRAEPLAGSGQRGVDDAVRILRDRGAALAARPRLDDERPHRGRAEVESQGTWLATARHALAGLGGRPAHAGPLTRGTTRPGAGRASPRCRRRR